MAVTAFDFAGASSLYASKRLSNGLMAGFVPVASAGDSAGMRRMKAVQTVPNPLLEPTRVTNTGDNVRQTTYQFANGDDAGGTLEMGFFDIDLESAFIGLTSWTLGNWKIGLRGNSNPIFSNIILLAHSQATSKDSATYGQAGYMNTLFPNCQLLPLGQESQAYQTVGKNRYAIVVNPITETPLALGQMLSQFASSDGLSFYWWSAYPCLMHAKIGNGTWDTITIDGTLVNAAATKVYTTNAGTSTAATVSGATAQTITLSAVPSNNHHAVAIFETSALP